VSGDTGALVPRKRPNNLPRGADGKVIPGPKIDVTDKKAALNPRQAILTAFGDVGGVRWLKKLAKRYPKDFASLLAKVMPQELSVTGSIGYAALPIPVEVRDPIEGEFTEVPMALALPAPAPQDVPQDGAELDPFT
jgi:hypothetical protein